MTVIDSINTTSSNTKKTDNTEKTENGSVIFRTPLTGINNTSDQSEVYRKSCDSYFLPQQQPHYESPINRKSYDSYSSPRPFNSESSLKRKLSDTDSLQNKRRSQASVNAECVSEKENLPPNQSNLFRAIRNVQPGPFSPPPSSPLLLSTALHTRKTVPVIPEIRHDKSFPESLEATLKSAAPVSLPETVQGAEKSNLLPPISLQPNPQWVDPKTRAACKYSPVLVGKTKDPDTIKRMQEVLLNRLGVCKELAAGTDKYVSEKWLFSFIGRNENRESRLTKNNVPVIVISGGSANKIADDLAKDYSLAWHPKTQRDEPVYLLVHRRDYETYNQALKHVLEENKNMHLIGWDCGSLTGFGAVRGAALALADTLPYQPEKILMADQDVIQTEGTRHTSPDIQRRVNGLHVKTGKPIVGFGVGYPTRVAVPERIFARPPTKENIAEEDLNSPTQQFVSIKAPFRNQDAGIYPLYMVSGGEDMLMGKKLELTLKDENGKEKNTTLINDAKILKKTISGKPDTPNAYWNKARVNTLKKLFEAEKNTPVEFNGEKMSLDKLMQLFVKEGWVKPASDESGDFYNTASCIIERIILRLHTSGGFPSDIYSSVIPQNIPIDTEGTSKINRRNTMNH